MAGGRSDRTVEPDVYRIARDAEGRVSCVRTHIRIVEHIPVHCAAGFECGPGRSIEGANDLALVQCV
jgi:hypothetical protein